MDRTDKEVALRGLRLIGVVAADEPATADQMSAALLVLSSVWAEVQAEARATWDIVTGVPPEAFMPLAHLLAAELAGEYGVAAPMSGARAKLRLLAVIRPDDRCCDDKEYDPCADYGRGQR